MATKIELIGLYSDWPWIDYNPMTECYPWLAENLEPYSWKFKKTNNIVNSIIFYNDEDAVAFRLRFGL